MTKYLKYYNIILGKDYIFGCNCIEILKVLFRKHRFFRRFNQFKVHNLYEETNTLQEFFSLKSAMHQNSVLKTLFEYDILLLLSFNFRRFKISAHLVYTAFRDSKGRISKNEVRPVVFQVSNNNATSFKKSNIISSILSYIFFLYINNKKVIFVKQFVKKAAVHFISSILTC